MEEENYWGNVELLCERQKRLKSKIAWDEIATYLKDDRNYNNVDVDYLLHHGLITKEPRIVKK